jgi:endonuclease/exonuclease/phosphatase family metal-dependent hydrolase
MTEFSLLSLNTFGLPLFLGWNRLTRLTRKLDELAISVLCLQEIQQNAYVPVLDRGLPGHKYHAYERNWFAPKGGLFTAAREPLQGSEFVAYDNRGRALSPGFADWALKKGVLVSRLKRNRRNIIVMNTHLHANYAGNWERDHALSKIQRDQVLHLVQMVNAQPTDSLVLVCGDFNFPRGTWLYDELLAETSMVDPLAMDPRPTYRPLPLMSNAKWALPIDFCFVRLPLWHGIELQADILQVEDSSKPFRPQRFLTDHNALTLDIKWDD